MAAVTAAARLRFPGLPITLLGHSLGSFASQGYLRDHSAELSALVLSGTARLDLMFADRAAAHLDHDPGNNRLRNLKAFCQRCHMLHDRAEHQRRRLLTLRMRKALGDLFLGRYSEFS